VSERIESYEELRSRYRPPSEIAVRKDIGRVDEAAASYLAASPFFVIASSSDEGCDASPRGGPPGFVRVLDDHRIAWGDLSGNNRLDTLSNVVATSSVGLLFLVPGVEETLRVNGRASVSVEPDVLDACTLDGRRPKVAVVVDVDACYVHCAKAFKRSGLWNPSSWAGEDERPRPECILRDHLALEHDADFLRQRWERAYEKELWEVGGDAG
jgi:uncharacterized protein